MQSLIIGKPLRFDTIIKPELVPCVENFKCLLCNNVLQDGNFWINFSTYSELFATHHCTKCQLYWLITHQDMQEGFHTFKNSVAYQLDPKSDQPELDSCRIKLIQILGSKCSECPVTDFKLLAIHHIFNDGKEDRKINWYKKYLQNIPLAKQRLQVLCMNCHWLKTRNRSQFFLVRIVVIKKIKKVWKLFR